MKGKVYKFYTYARKHGVRKAVVKTWNFLYKKARPKMRLPIDVMVDVEDVVKADYISYPYVKPQKTKKDRLKIGWVLSPISPGSGGQTTITRFARFLQTQGHEVTIYLYEGIHPQTASDARKILRDSFNFDVKVEKIASYEESDVLIATGWETAYPTFNVKTTAHKFYFIQDFEPYFYGLGSRAVLAENTYRMGFYGITAGRWLTHRVTTGYGMEADYFNFGADLEIYRPAADSQFVKQKKIAFYARPVTERRAFEVGVIALKSFHKKHPEYTIEFFGWDISEYQIPFPYVNRGVISPKELAELYHDSVACLVLSLTNVSLLPLELLAAGCIPVMNDGDNNRMVLGENKNIRYAPASPIHLACELSKAVEVEDQAGTAKTAAESAENLSWDDSYKKVETILMREVTGKQ